MARTTWQGNVALMGLIAVGVMSMPPARGDIIGLTDGRYIHGEIVEETKALFALHPDGTFTGRLNTKADVQGRIRLYDEMIGRIASDQ